MAENRIARVVLAIALTAWWGCGVDPKPGSGLSPGASRRGGALGDVTVPQGLDPEAVMPRQGAALEQAALSLDQVLSQIPRPKFLPEGLTAPQTPSSPQAAPPLAAQHAYVAGRQAWHNKQNFQAIEHLQAALQLAPKSPAVLRLLGKIYSFSGNRIRGAIYLEKAVVADPGDTDSLFLLGRLFAEQGRWTDAVATFAYAARLDHGGSEPALSGMLRYHLGLALDHEGFDTAAIDQLEAFLTRPFAADRTTRLRRHLVLLDRQRGATWQTVGDALNRLGRVDEALAAYQQAAQIDGERSNGLVRRLAFTALRLGRQDLALEAVQRYVRHAGGDSVSLALVDYLNDHLVDAHRLAGMLHEIYQLGPRSASLALTIAGLQDQQEARDFLISHLRTSPGDRLVFERLVSLEIASAAGGPGRAERLLDTTVTLIDLLPSAAGEYTSVLMEALGDDHALLGAVEAWPTDRRETAAVRFVYSRLLARVGRTDEAIAQLERATASQKHGSAVRVTLAGLLIERGAFERAVGVLDALPAGGNLAAVRLRLRVFVEQDDGVGAIRYLDELLGAGAANRVDLVVEKAKIQIGLGDAVQAQATLSKTLEANPRSEKLYELLLDLYRFRRVPDAEKHYKDLIRQMLKMVPHERVTRVERARLSLAGGRYDEAEPLLRTLLEEDADDLRPLDPLMALLVRTDRRDEAESIMGQRLAADPANSRLLEVALRHYRRVVDQPQTVRFARLLLEHRFRERPRPFAQIDQLMEILVENGQGDVAQTLLEAQLEAAPIDRTLLMAAGRHFMRVGDKQRLFESTEQLLFLGEPGLKRSRSLALLYLSHDRPQKAIDVLQEAMTQPGADVRLFVNLLARAYSELDRFEDGDSQFAEAIERFPNQAPDLRFDRAIYHDRWGRWQRAEEILLGLLEILPRHALANNALGYAWADRGVHLERAEKMIRVAVEAEGDNAAFLDSMGWVFYKQGRFDQAVIWLQRASTAPGGDYPVILDHLGDALYRVGRLESAVTMWQRAKLGVTQQELPDDRELEGLPQRTEAKIEAVAAKKPAPVAEAPGFQPADGAVEPPGAQALPQRPAGP